MITILRRLEHVFVRSRHDAELREEIEAHRALRQDAYEREGRSREDAARASRRALGNVAVLDLQQLVTSCGARREC